MYAVVVNIAVAELSTKKTFQSTEKETLMTLILFFSLRFILFSRFCCFFDKISQKEG